METTGVIQLLCFISVINAQSSEYTFTRDVNIGSSLQQSAFIVSFKAYGEVLCLGACIRDSRCMSCSFYKDASNSDDNCYLYNRVFTSSDYSFAKNADLYLKKCTTKSNAISPVCNFSLMDYFRNTTINSSITSYNGTTIGRLFATEMAIVNNSPIYFLLDFLNHTLIKMSSTWQFIAKVNTITKPRVIKWANGHLYVSSQNGFYKMDYNFNIKKSILDTNAAYTGIYHNASDNTLVMTVWLRCKISILDSNLTVLANISLGTYNPMGVAGYGDSLYVSAFNDSTIYVIRNRVIIDTITISTTAAMYIYSILIDGYGYMALSFENAKTVRLYHINGTTTGFKLTLPSNVYHVNFDYNRRLMISTYSALYVFN